MTLGLLDHSATGSDLVVETIPVRISGSSLAVPEAIGRPQPLFVYPDHGDHDYALVSLDPVSLEFALERLPELPDALLRQQTWSTLYAMVRAAELSPSEYLAAVCHYAPGEPDRSLAAAILDRAAVVLRRYLPDGLRETESRALVATALSAIGVATEDLRLTWARAAIAVAATAADVGLLCERADDGWQAEGLVVDQEMRWSLAIKAVAHALPGARARLDEEIARDRSDRGLRAALRAEASRPEAAAKEEAWQRINGAGYGSDFLTRAAIAGFQWLHQRDLLTPFRGPFYEQVAGVYASRDHAFARAYLRGLIADRWAEVAELERIRSFRESLASGQVLLARHLDEAADDLARDIRVRAVTQSS
jgi:aminopeptidase N